MPGGAMKTYLIFGLAYALAGAALTFALYLLGFHSDPAKVGASQAISTIALLAISAVCIVAGTKARRADVPMDEEFGYGRALGAGVMIVLFAALFSIVTNFVYMRLVNPDLVDVLVASQIEKWEAAGMNSQQIETAEAMMRKMMHPAIQGVSAFLFTLVIGAVVSLVTAAFLKRPATPFATATASPRV